MNIFNLFKKPIPYISGVLPDTRPPEEKQKDYKAEEIIPMAPILQWDTWENWKQKPENIKMLMIFLLSIREASEVVGLVVLL